MLALAPLAPFISDVVIDAKSGVSGAGREASAVTHFVSVDENVRPYGVGQHRHMPEIDQELALAGARELTVTFTPHLVPLDQGELVSCYVTLNEQVDIVFLGDFVAKLDHRAKFPGGVHVEKREGDASRKERLHGEMQHDARVLANRV